MLDATTLIQPSGRPFSGGLAASPMFRTSLAVSPMFNT